LERGAKIDAAMENGLTAIHLASQCGHYAVAKLLLDNSASIDARHEHSWTPLHFACFRGHATVVQLLCENGAMLNTINSEGYIPGQIFNSDVDPTVQFKIRAILEKCMQDEAEGKWRERYRMEKMSNQKAQVWIDHLRGMTENAERRVVYAQTAKGVAEKELAKKTAELGVAVFSKQQEVDELRKNLGHQTRRAELLEQTLQKQFPEELTKKAVDGKNRTETSLNNLEIAFKRMSAKMNFLSIKHQEEIRQIEDEKAFSEADNKNQLIKANRQIAMLLKERNENHKQLQEKEEENEKLRNELMEVRVAKEAEGQKQKALLFDIQQLEAKYKYGVEANAKIQVELDQLRMQLQMTPK